MIKDFALCARPEAIEPACEHCKRNNHKYKDIDEKLQKWIYPDVMESWAGFDCMDYTEERV